MAEWWRQDYVHGYRAHLPHPFMTSMGTIGCDVCGGHIDRRIHEPPFQRITEDEWRRENAAENAAERAQPSFKPHTFEARQARLRALKNKVRFPPAVSKALRGEREKVVHFYPETNSYSEFGDIIDWTLGRQSDTELLHERKEQPMLTEADLNRLKGLLHFLNDTKPSGTRSTDDSGRRLTPLKEAPEVKFVIDVYDKDGNTVGHIQRESGTYGFRPSS